MINIEKIKEQVDAITRCVNNYEHARVCYEIDALSPNSTKEEVDNWKSLMDRTENTLKTQLRIMADDNREVTNG